MDGDTRPLTDAERRYLEWWAQTGGLPGGPTTRDKVVIGCTGAGCLTILVYGAAALVMKILMAIAATHAAAHRVQKSEAWGLAAFALPIVMWAGMLIYLFTQ